MPLCDTHCCCHYRSWPGLQRVPRVSLMPLCDTHCCCHYRSWPGLHRVPRVSLMPLCDTHCCCHYRSWPGLHRVPRGRVPHASVWYTLLLSLQVLAWPSPCTQRPCPSCLCVIHTVVVTTGPGLAFIVYPECPSCLCVIHTVVVTTGPGL